MASTPLTFSSSLVAPVRASSRKPDQNRLKPPSSTWWAPLFGWSSDPDYITADASLKTSGEKSEAAASDSAADRPRSRFAMGGFTEEKARQLRKKTAESSSFHDVMYHSAIASRLASEISEK